MPRRHNPSNKPARRSGAALLLVVIAIVVSAMIVGTLAQMAISQHRQIRREHDRIQTQWLIESGLDRAAARLTRDAGYTGEEWRIDLDARPAARTGLVTIRVDTPQGDPQHRRVAVHAEFPAGALHRTRLHSEQVWTLAVDNSQSTSTASAISPENVVP
jgi:hypothetical protein